MPARLAVLTVVWYLLSPMPGVTSDDAHLVQQGIVVDTRGQPVVGAVVSVCDQRYGQGSTSAFTDRRGGFRIPLAGLQPICVRARGFSAVRLDPHQLRSNSRITLEGNAQVSGVVRDGLTGRPVVGCRVELREALLSSLSTVPQVAEAITDSTGKFRFARLLPLAFDLSATSRGYAPQQLGGIPAGTSVEFLLRRGISIQGVVRGSNDMPLGGAAVQFRGFRQAKPISELRTDGAGRFQVSDLEAGAYTVRILAANYAPHVSEVVIATPQQVVSVNVRLTRGGSVAGRLIGAGGRPAQGSIRLLSLDGRPTPEISQLQGTAGTDGRFTMMGLPVGLHVLAASGPDCTPRRIEARIRDGQQINLGDIELSTGLAIAGRVHDPAGHPVVGASVRAVATNPSADTPPRTAETAGDGAFVLSGLVEGIYRLTATAPAFGTVRSVVNAGTQNANLVLHTLGAITGRVLASDDYTVDSFVVLAEALTRDPGHAHSAEDGFPGIPATGGPVAYQDASGRFRLDLPAGEYRLRIEAAGLEPKEWSPIAVTAGAVTGLGRIRLRDGGTIRGTVVDKEGTPVAGAGVTVIGQALESSLLTAHPSAVASDDNGEFEIRGLASGTMGLTVRHPSFAVTEVLGIEVDAKGDAAEARVVMRKGGSVAGSIRGRDGMGIAAAHVQLMLPIPSRPGFFSEGQATVSADDGSFAFERVRPGRVKIAVGSSPGFITRAKDVEITEAQRSVVEFRSDDVVVWGHVRRGPAPLPHARVKLVADAAAGLDSAIGDTPPEAETSRGMVVTGEDGRFQVTLEEPGLYSVLVRSPDTEAPLPIRTVSIPDVDIFELDLDYGGTVVSGLVVDFQSGAPVQGAMLEASALQRELGVVQTAADSEGRFQFELTGSRYAVKIAASGYASRVVDLKVTTPITDLRLELRRGSSLAGRVVDSHGRPVAGVSVSAVSQRTDDPPSVGLTETQADGTFRIEGLEAKSYNLFAGSSLAGGFAVRVGAQANEDDLILQLRPGGRIRLTILDSLGQPASGAFVQLAAVGGARIADPKELPEVTGPEGSVDLAVPAGPIDVRASKGNSTAVFRSVVPEGRSVSGEVRLPGL